MADALELTDDDFRIAPDAPPGFWSKEGRNQLFTIVFISAIVLAFIQIIVPQLLVPMLMPSSMPSIFSMKVQAVQTGQAVWCQDRLWVSLMTTGLGTPPRTSLRAFNKDGTWDEASDLIVAAPFDKLIADGARLFLISDTTVSTVENRLVRTTYPKVKLNQPSQPFLMNGTLSILDHAAGQSDAIWYDYTEGEWIERGRIELPFAFAEAIVASRMTIPATPRTVRVRFSGGAVTPVMTGSQNDAVYIVPLPDGRVWVAVATAGEQPRLWTAINPTVGPRGGGFNGAGTAPVDALVLNDPATFTQWSEFSGDFTSSTAAVLFDDQPALVKLDFQDAITGTGGTSLQLFTRSGREFAMTHRLAAFPAETPVPLVKPDGTLLFLAASPFTPMSVSMVELTKDGFGAVQRVGDTSAFNTSRPGFRWIYALLTVIPTTTIVLMGLIAHYLVLRYRDRRFSFGHHTVRLASIARRGAARGVDAFLFGLPFTILSLGMWWWQTDAIALFEEIMNKGQFQTFVIWILGFFLGAMLYITIAALTFGTMEGLWGSSPGKWLFGVRVIRTTFEPIGFFRGMIRQFLLLIDGQIGYFVAILMASCLAKSQRLGDLCADSIVVEKSSLPPNWPRHTHTPST